MKYEDKKDATVNTRSVQKKTEGVGGNAIIEIVTGAQAFNLTELGDMATKMATRVMHRGCNGISLKLHLGACRTLWS